MAYRKPYDLQREFNAFMDRVVMRQIETRNGWFTAKEMEIPLRKLKKLVEYHRLEMMVKRRSMIREPRYYFRLREPVESISQG